MLLGGGPLSSGLIWYAGIRLFTWDRFLLDCGFNFRLGCDIVWVLR